MLAIRRSVVNLQTLTKTSTFKVNDSAFHFSTTPIPNAPPSSAYYDELIDFAGRNRDFATVHQLLNKRVKHGCFNTTSTFNFISTDLSILDDLLKHLNNLDGGLARKGAYNALIAQLSKLHETRKALHVADEMVNKDYGAKAATFHPILNAVTRRREIGEAWRVLDFMKERGIEGDTTAYNYILTGYCFVGNLRLAGEVLTKMRETGLKEDERSYDAVVMGACRWGKLEASLMLLRRMVDDGVTPLYATYAHVINAMCRDGYYAQGVEFVKGCGGRDWKLDVENFGVLVSRLVSLKRFEEAKVVVEEMENRNIPIKDSVKSTLSALS